MLACAASIAVSSAQRKVAGSVPAAAAAALVFVAGSLAFLRGYAALRLPGAGAAGRLAALHPFSIVGAVGTQKTAGYLGDAYLSAFLSGAGALGLLVAAGLRLKAGRRPTFQPRRPLVAADAFMRKRLGWIYRIFKGPRTIVESNAVRWRERIALRNMKGQMGRMTVSDKMVMAVVGVVTVAALHAWAGKASMSGLAWAIAGLYAGMGVVLLLYNIAFAMRAAQAFSGEFESGQMNLIRVTGLEGADIVRGKLSAYVSHYRPLLVLSLVWGASAGLFAAYHLSGTRAGFIASFQMVLTWPAGWPVAGLSIAAVALLSSLYYKTAVRSLYAAAVLAFLLPLATRLLAAPLAVAVAQMSVPVRVAIRVVIGGAVFMVLFVWVRNYDRSKLYSKQECLVLAVFAAGLLPRLAGGLLGAVSVYLVVRRLMLREFEAFMKDEPLLFLAEWKEYAAGGRAGRAEFQPRRGIAPSLQRSLGAARRRRPAAHKGRG